MDFNRMYSPQDVQEKWFEAQLQLAVELKLPVFLHEREAHQRFVEILKKYRPQLGPVVVHCFTGTKAEAQAYLDMDLHIGFVHFVLH